MPQRESNTAGRAPHYAGAVPSPARTASPAKRVAGDALNMDVVAIGRRAAVEMFNTRKWQPLLDYLDHSVAREAALRRGGLSALYGAAVLIAETLAAAKSGGHVQITGPLPSADDVRYAYATNLARFYLTLGALVTTARRTIDAAPGLTVHLPEFVERKVTKIARDANLEAREIEEFSYR